MRLVLCQPCKKDGTETVVDSEGIYEDRNISKLLNSLSVACIRSFCRWQGKLEKYDDHHENCPVIEANHERKSSLPANMDCREPTIPDNNEMVGRVVSNSSIIDPVTSITVELTNLQTKVARNCNKIDVVAAKTEIFESVSQVFQSTAEKVVSHCEEVKTLFAQQERENQSLKATVETMRNEITLLRHQMQQRAETVEAVNTTACLVWKITDFREKRRLATSDSIAFWLSPIFLTSQFGYRMQLKIYLNGDGTGKGKYVSLFFIILKSPYDDILSWPFQQKVKMVAMDQSSRGQHITDAFRPDLSSSSFQKPVGTANIATGCPLFMPLALLEAGGDGGLYVKDDVMYVKAIVDRAGLDVI